MNGGELLHRLRPRRALGRTSFVATRLGIGDLADRSLPLDACVATIHHALDLGLNLIDTAPAYEDGYSEQVVGAALKGRRDGVFVIDKIDHLDRPATPQVEESLRRLGMDGADLFVFHGLSKLAEWERLCVEGGGMDELADCVRAGKVRFRGISAHNPDVLLAAIESGLCDVVLFAVGPFVDARYVEQVLPLARERGVGTVCFKTFGAGKLVGDTEGYGRPLQEWPLAAQGCRGDLHRSGPVLPHLTAAECVHYTLTCDPDVALLGMSVAGEVDAAVGAARTFRPLSAEAMAGIRRRATEAVRGKGTCWWNPA